MLSEQDVALVLCDIEMPDLDGFNFLKLKMSKPEFLNIPVIMLTVKDHMEEKLRGLSEGASDYLTKPFEDQELVARVRVHLQIVALQDELKRRNKRLELLSRTDELTGLSNRRHFMERLGSEFVRSQRYRSSVSLVLLDVDHFKRVNDTYGHIVGDQVLVGVADCMTGLLRRCDVAARHGGEEFAMVLPETPESGALVVAERFRETVEEALFESPDVSVRVTVSLGVATYPGGRIETAEDLLRRADQALYAAKNAGRNRVVSDRALDLSRAANRK
jgi:diguanylate cyclase (GGDEF)-like protein